MSKKKEGPLAILVQEFCFARAGMGNSTSVPPSELGAAEAGAPARLAALAATRDRWDAGDVRAAAERCGDADPNVRALVWRNSENFSSKYARNSIKNHVEKYSVLNCFNLFAEKCEISLTHFCCKN